MTKIDKLTQESPVLKLMRQRDMVFPLDIIHRFFRDEHILMLPKPRFFTAFEQVKSELQLIHGGERFNLSADAQLAAWTSRAIDACPWFTVIDHPEMGRCVEIMPAARIVHDVLMMTEIQDKGLSGQSIDGLFADVIDAAARIKGDNAAIIRRAEQEIEERRLMITRLLATGSDPISDKEKQVFASSVARLMTDMHRTISVVPERLKTANREAREVFHHSQAPHGEMVNQVFDVIMREIQSPGYESLDRIAGLALDDDKREELEEAIRTIVEACGDMMTDEMHRQTQGFLAGVSQVSRQVISQHRTTSDTILNFVRSDAFQTRNAETQALMRLAEALKSYAPHTRMSKRSLTSFGLRLKQERAERHRVFDMRIASDLPSKQTETVLAIDENAEPNPEVVEMAKRAIQKAHHLDTDRMKTKIEAFVREVGPVSLSWVLRNHPPRYGSEEITRYVQIALERVPSVFPDGWSARMVLPAFDGQDREYTFSDPVFRSVKQSPEDARREAELLRPYGKILLPNGGLLETLTQQEPHT